MTQPSDPQALADSAARELTAALGDGHDVAVVMGSGWAPAADAFGDASGSVAIGDLPGFAAPTAIGHGGQIRSVRVGDRKVLLFLGRTHLYEGRGVEPVVHGVRTAALVEVRAAQEEQHPTVTDAHRAHLAAVPDRRGCGEAGELPDRDRRLGGAERVRGRRPSRAHHDRDVVLTPAGCVQVLGREGGEGSGIGSGGGLAHAWTLTQPQETVCGARVRTGRMRGCRTTGGRSPR